MAEIFPSSSSDGNAYIGMVKWGKDMDHVIRREQVMQIEEYLRRSGYDLTRTSEAPGDEYLSFVGFKVDSDVHNKNPHQDWDKAVKSVKGGSNAGFSTDDPVHDNEM